MIRQSDSAIRDLLASRLAALGARVGAIEDGFSQPLDDDFAEQAVDRENDEAQEALESAALAEIEQVRAALHRLDTLVADGAAAAGLRRALTSMSPEMVAYKRLDRVRQVVISWL